MRTRRGNNAIGLGRLVPERPSLEYLRKLAKERLRALRRNDQAAKLADAQLAVAQLAVAREHGFPSWRALWFLTDHVQDLYSLFKRRQLRAAQTGLTGASANEPDVPFEEDLYAPFYGGRQFSIRDNNGLTLIFWQPEGLSPRDAPTRG